MIETREGFENLEAIVRVEGLSGIYIGPSDLSMTLEGSLTSPLSLAVKDHILRIVSASRAASRRVGIFCPDVAFAKEMISAGCDLITIMNDVGLLRKATSALMDELRA